MTQILSFFATCPKGVGDLLAAELASLGAQEVREAAAGVFFTGDLETAYGACLWSRVASRILLPVARFEVASAEDLYAGVREVAWEEHFDAGATFAVGASGKSGTVTHTHYASLKVKDAVADRFREITGRRPSVDVRDPSVRINLHLGKGEGTVSLDLSGDALHRRGYRVDRGEAPLKENLAAAILLRAGWPAMALQGAPLLDPMCGSGTLLIEGAFMAGDVAPGILRSRFGFEALIGHRSGVWTSLQVQARYRMKEGLERLPVIIGYDSDRAAVRAAHANLARAGLDRKVHVERRNIDSLEAPGAARGDTGLVVVNPPYGERLGDPGRLPALYATLGERLRRGFTGWRAAVFTGDPGLGREIGMRAVKTNNLYNGDLKCRLWHFDLAREQLSGPFREAGRERRPPAGIDEEVRMFANRLSKNLKSTGRWARREGITCYRLYDADVPQFNLAVDIYEDRVHVQEYRAPHGVDPGLAADRLEKALLQIREVLGLSAERITLKVRRRQLRGRQYGKMQDVGRFEEVHEGGLTFLVNLTDYLDTGLFLDHRRTRDMIRSMASGRDFLNLFCYTGSATVYAAAGGAASTTSVDMSNTYLRWARRNMEANGLTGPEHTYCREDVLSWIAGARRRYGLIFLDPPTYSRSRAMEGDFDVQRDHVSLLLNTAGLLTPGGTLVFSTNRRGFTLDRSALAGLDVEDISRATIPRDFEQRPDVHRCFRITAGKPQRGARR